MAEGSLDRHPFTTNNMSTVLIHYDSQATLARAYSGVYNGSLDT